MLQWPMAKVVGLEAALHSASLERHLGYARVAWGSAHGWSCLFLPRSSPALTLQTRKKPKVLCCTLATDALAIPYINFLADQSVKRH